MNELITILIIIAAIISFLNKIFRQSKESQAKRSPTPVAKPKPEMWRPPWLLDTTSDQEFSIFETEPEEALPATKPATEKPAPTVSKKNESSVPVISKMQRASKIVPLVGEISDMSINLTSANEIRQGIVLAEILGPCKANRKRKRYWSGV